MSAIFVSHRSTDNDAAAEVSRWLKDRGHRSVFVDFDPIDGIPAGRDWEQEVYRQLRACRAVVAVCSQASMTSKWCAVEIAFARALGKPVLPVKIDNCTVHELIADRQVIDLTADRTRAYERLSRGLLAAGLDPADAFDWDGDRTPYPGLLAFQQQDAAVFFGREREITDGLAVLNKMWRLGVGRVLTLVGASGSGKSSLVRAGLVPRLCQDTERWVVADPFRPRDDPFRELAGVLSRALASTGRARPWGDIHDVLIDESGSDHQRTTSALAGLATELRMEANRSQARVLLVVDQLEELLGFQRDHPASRFLAMLCAAVEAPDSPLMVLATLRSDFVSELHNSPILAGLPCESLTVGPLAADGIAQVIEGPATVAGLELEAGLVQALVDEGHTDAGLPLLAFALRELYERFGRDGRLTIEDYRSGLGGLHGAIARVADEVVDSQHLTPEQLDELRVAFLAMVRVSEDARWATQTVPWDDLSQLIHPVLEQFVQARLLVASASDDNGTGRALEVAHEALLRAWGLLARWLDDNAAALRLRHDVQRASQTWHDSHRNPAELWRGPRLARAVEQIEGEHAAFGPGDREFVAASQQAERTEADKQARRRRRQLQLAATFTIVTSIVAVIAVAFFFRARDQSHRANVEANQATALALAAASRTVQQDNPALALALATEGSAATTPPLTQATHALLDARTAFANRSWQPIGEPLIGHGSSVAGTAFSPDGTVLASAGGDGTVRLWEPATGDPITDPLSGHHGAAYRLAFSPDGAVLASAGFDGTVRLWDPATGEPIGEPLSGHDGVVYGVAFSPDGAVLASAGGDGTVRLWDPATGDPISDPLTGHDGLVAALTFSPNGAVLASAGNDGTVRLWDVTSGDPIGEPLADQNNAALIAGLAFSPDSTMLATARWDATVRLWDPSTGEPIGDPLTGHDGPAMSVAFSPDGTLLASGGSDGTVRLWDPAAGEGTGEPLTGHTRQVTGVAFSPNGTVLASAGNDGTVRLWDPVAHQAIGDPLTGHSGGVNGVAFSPNGTALASAGNDATVRLWDPATGEAVGEPLTGHDAPATGVAFSPDGAVLASAGFDGTVRLWDPATGEAVGEPLTGHRGPVNRLAFSPDGSLLASSGNDGTVRLWDPATGEAVGEPLTGHRRPVGRVAFSPDGEILASAGNDGTVRLWDPATGEAVGEPLTGHDGAVEGVAFSPDAEVLASTGNDGTVRLWDPATGEAVGEPLTGHDGAVNWVAFSPDNNTFATAGDDRTVRLWNRSLDDQDPCTLVTPYIRSAQVQAYLPASRTPHACNYR